MLRPAVAVLGLLALACATPSDAGPTPAPAAVSPTASVGPALPSLPADANVFHGAITHVAVPARKPGSLIVDVESHRTATGTTVTLRAVRRVNCHVDKADAGAALYVCDTAWERRKVVPEAAFAFDGMLGTSSLTTTVDGKPLRVTWTGYGEPRQQVNDNGALLVRSRDAKAEATWGAVRHTDPDATKAPSLIYHRVTASASAPG